MSMFCLSLAKFRFFLFTVSQLMLLVWLSTIILIKIIIIYELSSFSTELSMRSWNGFFFFHHLLLLLLPGEGRTYDGDNLSRYYYYYVPIKLIFSMVVDGYSIQWRGEVFKRREEKRRRRRTHRNQIVWALIQIVEMSP